MEKRLLFINQSEEEINEFKNAIAHKKFLVDTARNGTDAATLMEQNHYGVVILDMYLKGSGGEHIIKYMNERHPDTVCIVYTYNLTRGQLAFLLNNRNIFRIFLSPANFLEEMIPAIEEAFNIYKMNIVQREEDKEIERMVFAKEKSIEEKNFVLRHKNRGNQQLLIFSERVLAETMQMAGDAVLEEKKRKLLQSEKELLESAADILIHPCTDIEDMRKRLETEFSGENTEMEFVAECEEGTFHKIELGRICTAFWILLQEYGKVSKGNRAGVGIRSCEGGGLEAVLHILLPKRMWEHEEIEQLEERRHLVEMAVAEIVDSCECHIEGNEVIYQVSVKK